MVINPVTRADVDVPLHDLAFSVEHGGEGMARPVREVLQPGEAVVSDAAGLRAGLRSEELAHGIHQQQRPIAGKLGGIEAHGVEPMRREASPTRAVRRSALHRAPRTRRSPVRRSAFRRDAR